MKDINQDRQIEMPQEIESLWDAFGNWGYEVSFSLQGGRAVYRELFENYQTISTLDDAMVRIKEDKETLVNYRFFANNLTPMFPIYADGRLFSKVSPRKFIDRKRMQSANPFEFKSEDTFFVLYRFQKNEYFGSSELRLRSGGFNKEDSKQKWNLLNALLREI
jgi:hypothetical protein